MRKSLLLIALISEFSWGITCQISSPLPIPISISGCTYGGVLPGGATSYIQNTLTPTTTTQVASLQNVQVSSNTTVAGSTFTLRNNGSLGIGQIIWADGTVQVTSPTVSSGGGGGGALGISSGSATNSIIISSPTSNVDFDSGTFKVSLQGTTTSYVRGTGSIVQYATYQSSNTDVTNNTSTPKDSGIIQTLTMKVATDIVKVTIDVQIGSTGLTGGQCIVKVLRDAVTIWGPFMILVEETPAEVDDFISLAPIMDSPGDISLHTYKLQFYNAGGSNTCFVNNNTATPGAGHILLEEISQ